MDALDKHHELMGDFHYSASWCDHIGLYCGELDGKTPKYRLYQDDRDNRTYVYRLEDIEKNVAEIKERRKDEPKYPREMIDDMIADFRAHWNK